MKGKVWQKRSPTALTLGAATARYEDESRARRSVIEG
jgi:hypothetical protein